MKRKERREKKSQKKLPEVPKFIDSKVCWPLGRLESKQSNNCNKVCTFPGLKRKERREKREEITKKAARDPQMRLFEQQQLTDNRVCWLLSRLESLHFKGGW